jgi:hypothetical protein
VVVVVVMMMMMMMMMVVEDKFEHVVRLNLFFFFSHEDKIPLQEKGKL